MLIVVRLAAFLVIAILGVALVAYVITRDARWLRFAFQVLRFATVAGIAVALLYMLERAL
jgi:hypothetical protein